MKKNKCNLNKIQANNIVSKTPWYFLVIENKRTRRYEVWKCLTLAIILYPFYLNFTDNYPDVVCKWKFQLHINIKTTFFGNY